MADEGQLGARPNVAAGDSVFHDPEFEQQMSVAEEIMKNDRDILRELAK